MCHCPFNQYVKVKLRDNGYQHINDDMKSKLTLENLWDIVFNKQSKATDVEDKNTSEDEHKLLYQAYLMTKAVLRRSNQSKWKERSGLSSNMLTQKDASRFLLNGDLVFSKDLNNSLMMLFCC